MNFKSKYFILLIIFLIYLISGALGEIFMGRGLPFIHRKAIWSIGIYTGDSPFNLKPAVGINNPVLTAKDVTDAQAEFVADPFIIKEGNLWFVFFELMNAKTKKGDIGLAASKDGLHWQYQKIVLSESFHLSYPYVFKWQGEYYMIPESCKANSIRLYKAVNFPDKWILEKILIPNKRGVDSSIVYYHDRWWIFASEGESNILRLYYANELLGPWTEHPKSPVIKNCASIARPGGRLIVIGDKLIRFAQDDRMRYGGCIKAFEIIKLTTTDFKEIPASHIPIIKGSGIGWNRVGMHHVDLLKSPVNGWIACVDGFKSNWFIHF